jgi:hypothetical protein
MVVHEIMSEEEEQKFLYNHLTNDNCKYTSADYEINSFRGSEYNDVSITLVLGKVINCPAFRMLSCKFNNHYNSSIPSCNVSARERLSKNINFISRMSLPDCRDPTNPNRILNVNCTSKGKVLLPPYRTNRTNGIYGMGNNKNIVGLRTTLCSGRVMNSIPKMANGTIIVPYYKNDKSDMITNIVPYYVGVTSITPTVTKPKFNAPPSKGSIFFTKRYFEILSNEAILRKGTIKNHEREKQSKITTDLILASYNTALLLKHLNEHHKSIFNFNENIYSDTIQIIDDNNEDLVDNGRLSLVMEPAAGHIDNYDGKVHGRKLYIESKMTLSIGIKQDLDMPKNATNYVNNFVPAGSLAYPRFGIYTNCSPLYDIECHSLHDTVHIQNNQINPNHRGSLVSNFFNNSPVHYYYEEGVAVTYVPLINEDDD